jgi:pimeloyl-[acyl-carrier protein] methyl ester esterase
MKLHVAVSGHGPDLVLLHGWAAHGGVWRMAVSELEQRFRVHRVDLPGHGSSDMCMPFTLDHIVAILSAALPDRATVCGWSLGGQLALRWAAVAPQQVKRLILIATTPCFVRRADWEHGMEIAVLDDFARDFAADPPAALQRFIALQAHGDVAERTVVRELRERFEETPPLAAALTAGLQLLNTTDLRAQLDVINQPALVLHGGRDAIIPPAAGVRLAQALHAARLAMMHAAAHAPFLSNPPEFTRQVAEFCDE